MHMPERGSALPAAEVPSSAEQVASAYLVRNGGEAWSALVELAGDALTDLDGLERRAREAESMVSAGYIRRGPPQEHPRA